MRLIFLREVSADNSSDDHAVAYIDPKKEKYDNVEDWEYGRYFYTIQTKAGKKKFLQAQLAQMYRRHFDLPVPITTVYRNKYKEWYKENGFDKLLGPCHATSDDDWELCGETGHETMLPIVLYKTPTTTDHYNLPCAPFYSQPYSFAVEFWKEAFEDILKADKMVSGGCDESGVDAADEVQFYRWLTNKFENVYAMKDPSGTWVLSSRNGGVCLVNFNDDKALPPLEMPYLMDINVSDKCSNGCAFCYKGCTSRGKQLDPELCNKLIATVCRHLPVAEIVVGGGDVADAVSELEKPWRDDITISTTLHWYTLLKLYDQISLHEFCNSFHSIAISITDCPEDQWDKVSKLIGLMQDCNSSLDVRVQIIPEMMTLSQVKKVYKKFWHVNLLGYKQTGRAKNKSVPKLGVAFWKYMDEKRWAYPIVESGKLCVDATFCKTYKDILLKKSPYNFARLCEQEGVGSVYLDAVNNKLYKNSHSTEYVDFNIQEFIKAQYPEEYFIKKLGELRGC